MSGESLTIPVGDATTAGRLYRAEGATATLVLAHGAGAPQSHPWMVEASRAIARHGVTVVTFDFLYTHARRRVPDRNDVLERTWRAVLETARARADLPARLFIGGKSMGGRIATQVAASPEVEVQGLVLLGYPLHPPGQPAKLRSAHLPRVRAPMLFVQGSRDAFGTPAELEPFVSNLAAGSRLFVVEGGDHSLARPKSSGVTLADTLDRVAREVAGFTASR